MHAYSKPLVRSMTRSLSLAVQHPDSLEEEAVFELQMLHSLLPEGKDRSVFVSGDLF